MEYPEEKNTFAMEDEFLLGMSVSYFFLKKCISRVIRQKNLVHCSATFDEEI